MNTVKRAKVPIRMCEVCAWALVKRCASCEVQHCDESVIRHSFYAGSIRRWRRLIRRGHGLVCPELAQVRNSEDIARPLEQAEPECDPVNAENSELETGPFPVASTLGESFAGNGSSDRCKPEPGEMFGGIGVNPAIKELPAYLEETSARIFELENSLRDVPKLQEELSVLKERRKKLQEKFGRPYLIYHVGQ